MLDRAEAVVVELRQAEAAEIRLAVSRHESMTEGYWEDRHSAEEAARTARAILAALELADIDYSAA